MPRRNPSPHDAVGVAFPLVSGARSTSATGKAVFAEAARPVAHDLTVAIEAEQRWRKRYLGHIRRLAEREVAAGRDAVAVPTAGLAAVYDRFEFVRDGTAVPIGRAATDVPPAIELDLLHVKGDGDRETGLAVPYRGQLLDGDRLRGQLDAWIATGTVEPSFAAAIGRVIANPDWLDLSDTTVVVLGAGAEMGPLGALCRWGATVAAIDLPEPRLWARILATVRHGAGQAHVPIRSPLPADADDAQIAAAAGADLTTELPEVARWLDRVGGPLVVGNYVYAPGTDNARVAVAADALTAHLLDHHRAEVAVAGLLTPTDVYAVPEEVVAEAWARFGRRRTAPRVARGLTAGAAFAPNYPDTVTTSDGATFGIVDCLIAQQGPNYALAKRVQQWRLRAARDAGVVVSANVAPATRTRSVTRNRVLAAAYAGAPRFDVEVFEPDTSNTLMAALLVHDLRHPLAVGNPATALDQPSRLFTDAAAHSGLWRQPYAPRSVLPLAAVLGFPSASKAGGTQGPQ